MSSEKEEQTSELAAVLPPLPSPSAGSADPSASLSALWSYIRPALDHIFCSPTNSVDKAPAIEYAYHMGIHAALYNYFVVQSQALTEARAAAPLQVSESTTGTMTASPVPAGGRDIYQRLNEYYANIAQKLLLGAPKDDTALVQYIIPSFRRYSAGAHAANRLLNYINRHYVTRAADDYSWFTLYDIEEAGTSKITKTWKARSGEGTKKCGYRENRSVNLLNVAEKCAQAANSVVHVIPLDALAMKRFRTEVIGPLMAVPETEGGKCKPGAALKSRLGHGIREILESESIDPEEQQTFVKDLAMILCTVGIRSGHPLRKKLEKC